MKIGRFVAILVVCCSASFSTAGASTTSPGEASKFIDTLASYALNILRSIELSLEACEANVRGFLAENYGIPRIGRFVLGKSWRGASDEQKRVYQRLFGELLTQVYAKRRGRDLFGRNIRSIKFTMRALATFRKMTKCHLSGLAMDAKSWFDKAQYNLRCDVS